MKNKVTVLVAGILAVGIAFAFLGSMAVMIGAIPLAIIIFICLGAMGWDFHETMRKSPRNGNGDSADGNAAIQ
ncbi:MAG: hypothetical protein MI741_21140 [Rhodospirillales bacterium]|nr:hypothetical protein [Rhodospirillales bacterium]